MSHSREAALLEMANDGDAAAQSELFAMLYGELHMQAARLMRGQRRSHTLQPTALVHELFLNLFGRKTAKFTSREHFLAVAARAMKNVLIDHARGKGRKKRDPGRKQVPVDDAMPVRVEYDDRDVDCIDLHDKLEELAELGPREARGAECVMYRYFGGLTMDEISYYMGVPKRTLERDFFLAKAWLHRELEPPSEDDDSESRQEDDDTESTPEDDDAER